MTDAAGNGGRTTPEPRGEDSARVAGDALAAFRAETAALHDEAAAITRALEALPAQAWARPTRCVPWRVREVVGHVVTVLARVPETTASTAPERPDTSAATYYRADDRFGSAANADRVRTAHDRAAVRDAASIVDDLAATVRSVLTACRREPADRVVRTRHGDAMLLSDFLTTRVVELAVHGVDIADALDRPPWLTVGAAESVQRLTFGPGWRTCVAELGWDPVTLLRRTTGRDRLTAADSSELARVGFRALAFG